MFGLTEYSKLGEDLGYKESVRLGVSKWTTEDIIEGIMHSCI